MSAEQAQQDLLDRLTQLKNNISNTVKAEVQAATEASKQGFSEEAAEACSQQLDELSSPFLSRNRSTSTFSRRLQNKI